MYLSRLANAAAGEGIDVKAERKNGEVFPFHITVAELPLMEDRKRRFVASGQDLTSKELQQAIIQRSQKMDAMGKLTGGIVHDYNNMLGVIIGFGELLEKVVGQDSSGQHYLQQIQNAAERSAILTSKLLSYSRQKPSQPTDVDINRVLLSQQDMLNKTLTVRVQLLMTLADNLPAINVDLSDLENAILNICINAMHAMSEGGRLVIQTSVGCEG